MEGNELISRIINAFFNGLTPLTLFESCPNHMLWEAIKQDNAQPIAKQDILAYLSLHDAFYVLSEPIPAIQNGVELEFARVESTDLLLNDKEHFWTLVSQEPAYLVSCDFKWMIVLTTENTGHGAQLCILVCA